MSAPTIICFAVKEEAGFFKSLRNSDACAIVITGMGKRNAEAAIRQALTNARPQRVITAGFAGGLNPGLPLGTIVYDTDSELDSGIGAKLLEHGAMPAKFHCADCVAVTAAEKQVLWQMTGADAVEMESGIIRRICRDNKIPSATIRVISDAANEDLPLDFNALMTASHRINFVKLAWQIAGSPKKISQLIRFQKQTQSAARKLGEALQMTIG
jgi:adenosylhomocysteine nucleosidase